MKITVEVEVPDKEDCKECQYKAGWFCALFRREIVLTERLLTKPCPACLERRKGR